MRDNDLRGIVLQHFYEVRHRDDDMTSLEEIVAASLPGEVQRVGNICDQLSQYGLIEWTPLKAMMGTIAGMGRITAAGVDVIEGTALSPITITLHDHSVSVSGSNVQIGNNNSQTVNMTIDKMVSAIDHSSASMDEKAEAKTLLQRIGENKLLATVLGTVLAGFGATGAQ
jgi:hypothetical protein